MGSDGVRWHQRDVSVRVPGRPAPGDCGAVLGRRSAYSRSGPLGRAQRATTDRVPLQEGDTVTFKGYKGTFKAMPDPERDTDYRPTGTAKADEGSVYRGEQRYALDPLRPFSVGFDDCNDLVVADDAAVSGTHCRIYFDRGWWWVEDRGARNGTRVNGLEGAWVGLDKGACSLEVGDTMLRIEPKTQPPVSMVHGLVTDDAQMRESIRLVCAAAKEGMNAVVLGETGTGKELLARAYYAASGRTGAFVPVNCATLSEELLQPEVYGYEAGSFTDAHESHAGLVEQADGGVLFLDEVGELGVRMQQALRLALDGRGRRMGSSQTKTFDVAVFSATHQDLAAGKRNGTVDGEFFYALGVRIEVPPLRERGDDVTLLARYLLEQEARIRYLADDAKAALLRQHWTGNVRELERVLREARDKCRGNEIRAADLNLPWQHNEPESRTQH